MASPMRTTSTLGEPSRDRVAENGTDHVRRDRSKMAALARVNFATQVAPKRAVRANAADRPMWLPGTKAPAHLNGQLAGDFGFDPLGLGSNADNLKW